jgi:hypothetical protein
MLQVEIKCGKEVIILIMKNRRRTSPMFLSWPQNDPFPPLHDDGEPQLRLGQYFSRPSINVEICKFSSSQNLLL